MSHILQKVPAIGEARDRRLLEEASSYVYQQTPQGEIQAHVFLPKSPSSTPRPVVVLFHGGMWESPMPTQFAPHCMHFAAHGAVAVAAETRVSSRHGTSGPEAIEDARELIRWLRLHAATFNLDPNRITAGGAAGGALLALLTAMPTEKALPPVDGTSCRPQALLLFSAVVNTGPKSTFAQRFPDPRTAKTCSPSSLVRSKLPPMLLLHGTADRVAPFAEAKRFRSRLRWRRVPCELAPFDRSGHSFFNFNVSHHDFETAIATSCNFLVKHGLLDPPADP